MRHDEIHGKDDDLGFRAGVVGLKIELNSNIHTILQFLLWFIYIIIIE